MTGGKRRSRVARVLRPTFEVILLVGSVVAGLGVVGSCVSGGSADTAGLAVSVIAGGVFAIVLVGAVFLFATMSRDLRLLRERFTENGEASASGSLLEGRDRQGPTGTHVTRHAHKEDGGG